MADPRTLVVEANERFWNRTGYKRGERLSRSDPADVRMMPVWMDIYREVIREQGGENRPASTSAPSSPTAPFTPSDLPARDSRGNTSPIQESGISGPMKGALIAGGIVAAGLLGKFLFTEAKYYGIAKKIERGSKRRSKAADR